MHRQLFDSVTVSTRERTREGFLNALAIVTAVGVQEYLGRELAHVTDEKLEPDKLYSVFRPPETVFNKKTLKSSRLKPVTLGHPIDALLDTQTAKRMTVGSSGEKLRKIGDDCLAIPIVVTDARALEEIENGNTSISAGYVPDAIIKKSGSYKGQNYDFVFDGGMTINHFAIIPEGRVAQGTILDQKQAGVKMPKLFAKKKPKALNDMDAGLLEKVSEKLLPELKTVVTSEDFLGKMAALVADKVANKLTGDADAEEMEDQDMGTGEDIEIEEDGDDMLDEDLESDMEEYDTEDPDLDSETEDVVKITDNRPSKKGISRKISALVDERANILNVAKAINSKIKTAGRSNKAILMDALKPTVGKKVNLKAKSSGYLLALAEMQAEKRQRGSNFLSDSSGEGGGGNLPRNGIHLREQINRIRRGVK